MATACDRVEDTSLGAWHRCSAHPKMWMLNQLHVVGPQPELTADALIAELDRGLADVGHRRAQLDDDATGRRLAEDMRKAGYNVAGVLVMELDGEPPAVPEGVVRVAEEPAMRALDRLLHEQDPDFPAADLDVVVEAHAHLRAAVPGTRAFVAAADGTDASCTTLYCDGVTGQPEDVNTLAAFRGRGLAAATVSAAARAALDEGCEFVFLVVDAETGPVPLYASLGFRPIGRYWAFTRPG
jgi:GNAT superfamily N-acetyltransferase